MSISTEQVQHIARLARLSLEPQEFARYAQQLDQILNYVNQLNELETSNIEPASHALPFMNVFRADQVQQVLSVQEVFQNAPEQEDHFFRVPQILSGEA